MTPRKARTVIHVNQHSIRRNLRDETDEPVLTVKNRGTNTYAHEAVIYGQDGREAARVVYDGRRLSCGARVWIETYGDVDTVVRGEAAA